MSDRESIRKAPTGIQGLDTILEGGFPNRQFVLIQGGPGTGKTTLALQFLLEGVRRGERSLYVSLLHGRGDIERIAHSHGWSLEGVEVETLVGPEDLAVCEQTVFHSAHVELGETIGKLQAIVERWAPERLVFDSISELQVLSDTLFRCRQQVVSLKQFLSDRCTALFTIGEAASVKVEEFEYVMEGLIRLRQYSPGYGLVRRSLEVIKMRGMAYISGLHDYRIAKGGLTIFPRRQAFPEPAESDKEQGIGSEQRLIESGVSELDALVGGGFEEGTATLLQGASGTGKSCLVTLYAHAAARQGKKSLLLIFDESVRIFLKRAKGIGLDLTPFIKEGLVDVRHMSIGEVSPGEISHTVRKAIERDKIEFLAIDSLSGYFPAVGDQVLVLTQLHELLAYTGNQGVLTFLTVAEHGLIGTGTPEPYSTTILADSVLLLRFFEARGSIRRAISVFKKRYGDHEKTIREMLISNEGIRLGEPLDGFSGILTGVPVYSGVQTELIRTGE
jgi:circadian clock protein KaiC